MSVCKEKLQLKRTPVRPEVVTSDTVTTVTMMKGPWARWANDPSTLLRWTQCWLITFTWHVMIFAFFKFWQWHHQPDIIIIIRLTPFPTSISICRFQATASVNSLHQMTTTMTLCQHWLTSFWCSSMHTRNKLRLRLRLPCQSQLRCTKELIPCGPPFLFCSSSLTKTRQ